MIYYAVNEKISYGKNMMITVETAGLLIINIISFYLCSFMEDTCLQNMEQQTLIQSAKTYEHQLNIIMTTQEQIRSLQHDMKYHIRELLAMAANHEINRMVLLYLRYEKNNWKSSRIYLFW
ncbi:MAG: hypothetical protein LBQ71_13180 [Hungatella sp.]|nr:hypothetical protein [Hungatella sp.]